MRLLLQSNNMWFDDVDNYLTAVINRCRGCRATAYRQTSQKVLLSSLNCSFNGCVCVDDMLLDEHFILHVMNDKTRFSAGLICDNASLQTSSFALNACWITPFWTPGVIRGDDAFNKIRSSILSNPLDLPTTRFHLVYIKRMF